MDGQFTATSAIDVLRDVIVSLVRREGPALSSHQLGVYLTCYLKARDQTVRGLARELDVSKSVITRALDRLGELDLAQRKPDPTDRRSVLVARTTAGQALMDELVGLADQALRGHQGQRAA